MWGMAKVPPAPSLPSPRNVPMGGRWPPIIGTQRDTRTGPRLSVGLPMGGRSWVYAGGEGAGGANNKRTTPTPTPDRAVQPAPSRPLPPSPERPPNIIIYINYRGGDGTVTINEIVTHLDGRCNFPLPVLHLDGRRVLYQTPFSVFVQLHVSSRMVPPRGDPPP